LWEIRIEESEVYIDTPNVSDDRSRNNHRWLQWIRRKIEWMWHVQSRKYIAFDDLRKRTISSWFTLARSLWWQTFHCGYNQSE
jgi:hypothetical protein